jgi:hypothetical protein
MLFIAAPKVVFWLRYMEVWQSQLEQCLKLDQTLHTDARVALAELLRIFISGIQFFLHTRPSEALHYVSRLRDFSNSVLRDDTDEYTYNPILLTVLNIWAEKVAKEFNQDLVLDDKITNIDFVLTSIHFLPLHEVPYGSVSDTASAKAYLYAYKNLSTYQWHSHGLDYTQGPLFDAIQLLSGWGGAVTASDIESEGEVANPPPLQMFE